MKRLILILFVLFFVSSCSDKPHVCDFKGDYQTTDEGHYRVCECGIKESISLHDYDIDVQDLDDKIITTYTCKICNYSYFDERIKEERKDTTEYFNSKLILSTFKEMTVNSSAKENDVILTNVMTKITNLNNIYYSTKTISTLNPIGEEEYKTETSKSTVNKISDIITLRIDEKYFSSFEIEGNTFTSIIKDDYSEEFIGVKASNVKTEIILNKDEKLSSITINYDIDNINYLVEVNIKY